MAVKEFDNGAICHVNFGKTMPGEICSEHLAVLFNIKGIKNCVLAVPLTSQKPKHFKTKIDYQNRNYLNMKYYWQHYIAQTDSVALLEQIKHISVDRIDNYYYDVHSTKVILNEKELRLLKNQVLKHIKYVLKI